MPPRLEVQHASLGGTNVVSADDSTFVIHSQDQRSDTQRMNVTDRYGRDGATQ